MLCGVDKDVSIYLISNLGVCRLSNVGITQRQGKFSRSYPILPYIDTAGVLAQYLLLFHNSGKDMCMSQSLWRHKFVRVSRRVRSVRREDN